MLDLTTETKILKAQAEMLRKEYAELYEQRNYMLQYEEAKLSSLYLALIGQESFQLFCLNGEYAQLLQRIKLAQAYFNRNELPNWESIEKQVHEAFMDYQHKVEQEAARLSEAKEFFKSNFLSTEDVLQVKNVYKLLVKKLHPDLNPNQTEEDAELFLKTQAAYSLSDLTALNEILLYLNGTIGTAPEVADDISAFVQKLTTMIGDIKQKIEKLNQTFPYSFREKLYDDEWVAAEQSKLKKQIEELKTEFAEKTEYLQLLKSWKPQLLH